MAFWNAGARDKSTGLDLLGVRQLDQSLEREWVSGITTLSGRARYFTLLPWMLSELYTHELQSGEGRGQLTQDRIGEVLARLKFVILASTAMGEQWGESGSTVRVLGTDLFSDQLSKFNDTGTVALPDKNGGDVQGNYQTPCRTLGLLTEPPPNSPLGSAIGPRVQELCALRGNFPEIRSTLELILSGGELKKSDLIKSGKHFSANGLEAAVEERSLLRRWLLEPYQPASTAAAINERFVASVGWIARLLDGTALRPREIVEKNYVLTIDADPATLNPVELAWFEQELRRRVHFSLELLLGDLSTTLRILGSGSVESAVEQWLQARQQPDAVRRVIGSEHLEETLTLQGFISQLPEKAFLNEPLTDTMGRDDGVSGNRAAYALALLCACRRDSANLRSLGILTDRNHAMEGAFKLLDENLQESIRSVLCRLTLHFALEPHLETALRKLGQGQKCSLRFYPEGNTLHPTGVPTWAGFSGSRIVSVLNILADIGFLKRRDGGSFELDEDGRKELLGGANE